MTPFEPFGGTEVPIAPIDIPVPDLPAADFTAIGQQFAAGQRADAAANNTTPSWLQWIVDAFVAIVTALLSIWEMIVQRLLAIFLRILAGGSAESEAITDTVLGGLLTGKHDTHTFSLVDALLNTLKSGAAGASAGSITPTCAGAENFMHLSSRLAIESWIWGVMGEEFSLGFIKDIGGLKDALESGLGLGRLARRALAPPMKIFVADPFTWLLHQTYRPTLLNQGELVRQYLRGAIDRAALDAGMALHGYTNDKVDAIINVTRVHLPLGDIHLLLSHSYIERDTAVNLLKQQGYDEYTAGLVLTAQSYARADALQFTLNTLSSDLSALHKGTAVSDVKLPPADKLSEVLTPYFTQLAQLKLIAAERRFSVAEGELLVKKGLWDLSQFQQLAADLGYSPEDETTLELLTFTEIKTASDAAAHRAAAAHAKAAAAAAKAAAAAAKAAAIKAAEEAKGVGISKYETLVKDGVKTITEYGAFLAAKGIAPDNVAALSTVLQAALDKAAAAAATKAGGAAAAAAKHLDLAQLEAAVKDGTITIAEFNARLLQAGFAQADVDILVSVLSDQLAAAKLKVSNKTAAIAAGAGKGVNLAQEETAVRIGLQTIAQYSAFLAAHGYAVEDAALLTSELAAQLGHDKTARTTKTAVTAALKAHGINLATLEKAVRAGVSTIADYQTALAAQGYGTADQATLVSLLELQMSADQQTLAAKGSAAALLTKHGVSLANLERAVKLGVVAIAVYTDALARAGIPAADAQILTLSLAAGIKTTKAAAKTNAAAAKLMAAAGFNLAMLEKDVLAGKLTVEQLQSQLAGAGVPDADQSAIVALLRDELTNTAAVTSLTADASKRAAAKGLSLAQETAAVKADVKTLDDYGAFVAALGYDDANVATLVATLAAQLSKATKGKTAPAPAGGSPAVASALGLQSLDRGAVIIR